MDITPDPSLLAQIGLTQDSAAHFLADLVDNAIDARGGEPARVDITVTADRIVIRDWGDGMDEEQLQGALVLGRSAKPEGALGQYGFGLKSAIAALGRTAVITTSARGDGRIWQVHLDPEQIARRRGSRRWQLEYAQVEEPGFGHGTRIEIRDPKVAADADAVRDFTAKLSHIYGELLRQDVLRVTLNGIPLAAPVIELIGEREPLELFTYDAAGREYRVTGWAGVSAKPRRVGSYGFNLMWRGRVIVPWDTLGRRPHTSWNRLVGALHLDALTPTQNKRDFLRDTVEFRLLQETIWGGILNPIMERISGVNQQGRAERLARGFVRQVDVLRRKLCSPEALRAVERYVVAAAGQAVQLPKSIALSCEMARLGAGGEPYVVTANERAGTLEVSIRFNQEHVLFAGDPRNIIRWMPGAAVDVLSLTLSASPGRETLDASRYTAIRQALQLCLSAPEPPRTVKGDGGRGRSRRTGAEEAASAAG